MASLHRGSLVARLVVAALAGLVGASCFSAPAADVMFSCEPDTAPSCPSGYTCEADGCCHRDGSDVDAHLGECRIQVGTDTVTGVASLTGATSSGTDATGTTTTDATTSSGTDATGTTTTDATTSTTETTTDPTTETTAETTAETTVGPESSSGDPTTTGGSSSSDSGSSTAG